MARLQRDYPGAVVEKTRHGRRVIYYRIAHGQRVRLPDDVDSAAFQRAYEAAREGRPVPGVRQRPRPVRATPGSFGEAWRAYRRAPAFAAYDEATQAQRVRLFEAMCAETIRQDVTAIFADCPLASMRDEHVRVLRDRAAAAPEQANHRLKALRAFFAWAVDEKRIATDPTAGVKRFARRTAGHHTWTVEEALQFIDRHPLGSNALLAFGLMAFGGLRISDVATVGRQHARAGWFSKPQWKNRKRAPTMIEVPILPILRAIIDASRTGDMAYLVTATGRPYSLKSLGMKFKRWCVQAGLPHCSAHGVRKAGATIAAENGATEHQLMAIYNWESPQMAALYTRRVRRKRLAEAGMDMVVAEQIRAKIPHLATPVAEGAGETGELDNKINAA